MIEGEVIDVSFVNGGRAEILNEEDERLELLRDETGTNPIELKLGRARLIPHDVLSGVECARFLMACEEFGAGGEEGGVFFVSYCLPD
jgi:hypothetical protein